MESLTKTKLTPGQIGRIITKAFGAKAKIVSCTEITDGWFNTIYDIATDSSPDVILKLAPDRQVRILRYEKDLLHTEAALLTFFREKTDIPVPAVLFRDFSSSIIDNEYFIMEKLNGTPLNKIKEKFTPGQKASMEKKIGEINGKINSITGSRFGYYIREEEQTDTWTDAFLKLVRNILDDAEDFAVKLPLPHEELYGIFHQHEKKFGQVIAPQLVHWDLHDGNILVNSDNAVTGIIDCDRALWGDPLIEIYFSRMYGNAENFRAGYGREMFATIDAGFRRLLYDIYLSLIMVVECGPRGFSNPGHIEWVRRQLDEQLNNYHIAADSGATAYTNITKK